MPNVSQPMLCPWWLIHAFDHRLRRHIQRPDEILRGLIEPSFQCLDVGCGYGFLTLPMARAVGPQGSVTAVDLQQEMLDGLRRRAEKERLLERIHLHRASPSGLGISGPYDFALAFWMMHEVHDQASVLGEITQALKLGGNFLLAEPKVHVNAASFDATVALAERCGLSARSTPHIFFSRAAVFEKTKLQAA